VVAVADRRLGPTSPARIFTVDRAQLAVRVWLAELEADGVGQATRAKAYRLLARILGAAPEARYIAANPYGIRRAASDGAPEMRIATVDQVAAVANQMPPRYPGHRRHWCS
jgi:hypothetical protein